MRSKKVAWTNEKRKAPGMEVRRRMMYLWRMMLYQWKRRQLGRGERWRCAHTLTKAPVLETVAPPQGVRESGAGEQAGYRNTG